jgi:hypothetical protein
MFTFFRRSWVIVKDDMPTSYLGPSAGRIPVNSALCTSVFKPSFLAIAVIISMSYPVALPLESSDSAGGYSVLDPTIRVPRFLICSGSCAASAGSSLTEFWSKGAALAPPTGRSSFSDS